MWWKPTFELKTKKMPGNKCEINSWKLLRYERTQKSTRKKRRNKPLNEFPEIL
jgi:hypothetical protein